MYKCFLGVLVGFGLLLYTFNNAMAQDVDMMKIITIESGGNEHAYNPKSKAAGLCQITPIVYQEYIKMVKPIVYPQLFNFRDNLDIGYWYMNKRIPQLLKHYHIEDTIENRLRAYNSGIGTLVKGRYPQETRDYVKKYFAR